MTRVDGTLESPPHPWTPASAHPVKGNLQCWRRQGCPVMREDEALLLEELEKIETENELEVGKDVEE